MGNGSSTTVTAASAGAMTSTASSSGVAPPTAPSSADASHDLAQYVLSQLSIGDPTTAGFFGKCVAMLADNPYFGAGAGLYFLTVAGRVSSGFVSTAQVMLRRRLRVSMEMTSNDCSYEWMMRWLSAQPAFAVQQFSVITRNVNYYSNDAISSEHVYGPSPNINHYFFYKGRPILLRRNRQADRAMGSEVLETLELSTIGLSTDIMKNIIADAERLATERDSDRTVVYQNSGNRWTRSDVPRARRPMNSVVLDGDVSTAIVEDVRLFLKSSAYYRDLGVPYRRGYLLHGPPGCGKSSFVMALAGEMHLSICTLSLSSNGVTDEVLSTLLNSAPLRSMVLLEDIDRAFSSGCQVTMSGLLNALDGVAAQEGRIVFMTTNHVERLDAALIRPGRVDMKKEIGLMSREQGVLLFTKFFPKATPDQKKAFADALPNRKLSVAQIQSHLFLYRNEADLAIRMLPHFVEESNLFEQSIRERREKSARTAAALANARSPPIIGM